MSQKRHFSDLSKELHNLKKRILELDDDQGMLLSGVVIQQHSFKDDFAPFFR